jgi:hypothetical protein
VQTFDLSAQVSDAILVFSIFNTCGTMLTPFSVSLRRPVVSLAARRPNALHHTVTLRCPLQPSTAGVRLLSTRTKTSRTVTSPSVIHLSGLGLPKRLVDRPGRSLRGFATQQFDNDKKPNDQQRGPLSHLFEGKSDKQSDVQRDEYGNPIVPPTNGEIHERNEDGSLKVRT